MINPSAISRLLRGAGCRMAKTGAGLRVRRASTHYAEVLAIGYGPDVQRAEADLKKAEERLYRREYVVEWQSGTPRAWAAGMLRVCEGGA